MNIPDARRAALTLHALPAADREWVLRRLDPRQQLLLEDHLRELQSLGVLADAQLVNEALASADDAAANDWRSTLSLRDAEEMHSVLQGEPASLVARVLACGPWPWEASLLERMSPARRARVAQLRHESRENAVLDEWLLAELVRRCGPVLDREAAAVPRADTRRTWSKRFKGLL